MLRYVLVETSLFEPGADPAGHREDLGWLLEALTRRDQQYLIDHPSTPLLYQSGVRYERPGQFLGDCPEVKVLRDALGSRARDADVSAALETVQTILGGERFRDIGIVLQRGSGDCDNLAPWRAAELRQAGINASPFLTWRQRGDGGYTYHVQVRWPDNTIEDPSLLLGMRGDGDERDEQIRWNQERVDKVKAAATIAGLRRSR